jgi:hypothetical protein
MANLTIYNCGTGYDRRRRDVVAQLFNETTSNRVITDGVGTTSDLDDEDEHTLKEAGSGRFRGQFFAKGLHANVEQMVDLVKKSFEEDPALTVDMCG